MLYCTRNKYYVTEFECVTVNIVTEMNLRLLAAYEPILI